MPIDEVMGLMLGVPGAQGGGVRYLFRDLFSDVVAAGEYHNTRAVPGLGTRLATDTESKLSGDGTALICAGGRATPGWNNPRITWQPDTPIGRQAGIALLADVTPNNIPAQGGYVGWSSAVPATNLTVANSALRVGINAIPNWRWAIFTGGGGARPLQEYTVGQTYRVGIVLRSAGAFFCVESDSERCQLLYVASSGQESPLYPCLVNFDAALTLDNLDVVDLSGTRWGNDFGICDGAYIASPEAGATIDAFKDSIIEFTWTPGAGETLSLYFRHQDDDNCWRLDCSQAGGTIKLYKVEKGVATELDPGKTQTWTVDVPHRIMIFAAHEQIRTYVSDSLKHSLTASIRAVRHITTDYKVKTSHPGEVLASYPLYLHQRTGKPNIPFSIDRAYAAAAPLPLTTPTYDGSGEAVHPSVYDAGEGNAWNGYRYWMAMTPYPEGDLTKENPSILVSNDKVTWVVPDGLTNPINIPEAGYNADPALIMIGNALWCIWKWASGSDELRASHSEDGVTWSEPETLLVCGHDEAVSPAVVFDGSQYIMFTRKRSGTDPNYTYTVERRTCDTINGTWSDPVDVTPELPDASGHIWHLDVIRDGSRLFMIADYNTGSATSNGLLLGYSDDWGLSWTMASKPVLSMVDTSGTWAANIYRATIVRTAFGFDCWYSGYVGGPPSAWHIGYTEIIWQG